MARRLKLAVLAALDERVSTRYALAGMNLTDTGDYVRHHLKLAGRSDVLFSDDAVAAPSTRHPAATPEQSTT